MVQLAISHGNALFSVVLTVTIVAEVADVQTRASATSVGVSRLHPKFFNQREKRNALWQYKEKQHNIIIKQYEG